MIENDVSSGFVKNGFYYIELFPLYGHSLDRFYQEWVLNIVKRFFCIYWDDHMAFILQFVNIVYHIDWFAVLKNTYIPGINPTWSQCIIILIYCYIQFANILLRNLHLCLSRMLIYNFLFMYVVSVCFWYWVMVAL